MRSCGDGHQRADDGAHGDHSGYTLEPSCLEEHRERLVDEDGQDGDDRELEEQAGILVGGSEDGTDDHLAERSDGARQCAEHDGRRDDLAKV